MGQGRDGWSKALKSRACKGSRLDGAWHGGHGGHGIGFVGVGREGPSAEHILVERSHSRGAIYA